VRPRSGIDIMHGLTILNSRETIDSDYLCGLKVTLINLSNQKQTIYNGERIAQLIFAKVESALNQVQKIKDSPRGKGGFGRTGNK
jgi:dUTP pyrophosphatase